VLESLTSLVDGSPWTYALLLAVAALDAVFPIVPSETMAIAAGVLAGAGELSLALVIAAAAAGAFLGDNGSYLAGRTLGTRVRGAERARAWAARALERRGGYIIVAARFVPGGRTAVTLTAGMTRMPASRYVPFAAVAAVVWASYAGVLGYAGGRAFEEEPLKALLVALAVAAGIAGAVEAYRALARGRVRATAPRPCG
jgi:membrane protein DedA with SNARE-associated domain